MEWLPFKSKSLTVFKEYSTHRPRVVAFEGAIRSGKTITSIALWWNYIMTNEGSDYLMAGYSLGSLSSNVIDGEHGFIEYSKFMGTPFEKKSDKEGNLFLIYKNKKIKLVGADNKQSPKRIRGISVEGVYVDEANIINREFFSMAIGRTSASNDKLILMTLNPDVPTHWLYTEYLDVWEKEGFGNNINAYKYYHFIPKDNPAIDKSKYDDMKGMYKGFEFDRFIKGKRVRTAGVIYRFKHSHVITKDNPILKNLRIFDIGVDIGKSESPTVYSLVGYTAGYKQSVILKEFYDKENIDVDVVTENLAKFVKSCKEEYPTLANCYVDSAEPLMIKQFKKVVRGVNIKGSKKEPIVDRIKVTNQLLNLNSLYIVEDCKHTVNAFTNAIYDANGKRLDDGSYEVDCLDAFEYCLEQHFKDIINNLKVV